MFVFEDRGANYKYDYSKIVDDLNDAYNKKDNDKAFSIIRQLCKTDLFFLIHFILDIEPINCEWGVERCKEAEELEDMTLVLWAREHWKSTILTYGKPIQDVLNNPNERICIFSHTRAAAKSFLRRIKHTLEQNTLLQSVFDDIFFKSPERQAPKWSEDEGLIIKRPGRFSEATFEGWGVIDGMPTGKHYSKRIYDDLVTETSVSTPDQINKVEEAFQLSHNLGARGGQSQVIGTIYHFADLHQKLKESGHWTVSLWSAEDEEGKGIYLTDEELEQKRRLMGSYVYSAQMLLDPINKENQKFRPEWIKYYGTPPKDVNKIVIVDPANTKKASSSYTVFVCLGVDALNNYFLLDMVRDKLELKNRWEVLRNFVLKNGCRTVYYEKNGLGAVDIQYHQEKQREESVFFNIEPINNASMPKEVRIEKLQPLFEGGRFFLPNFIDYTDTEGKSHQLISEFITDEFLRFPYCIHNDMLDCIASMKNKDVAFHAPRTIKEKKRKQYNPFESNKGTLTYMSI